MFEHLLKMIGFKPEQVDELLLQGKLIAQAITDSLRSSSVAANDTAFIAAYYRAQIVRHAKLSPDDNDLYLIEAYYPVISVEETINNTSANGFDNLQYPAGVRTASNGQLNESNESGEVTVSPDANRAIDEGNPNIGKS